jgi:esterase/lipase superfamily enzyme
MRREYRKWFSAALQRDMELLIYGQAGTRVLVFPTRMGRFFDYENFGVLDSSSERIQAGLLQFWCVDSVDGDSFYGSGPPAERIRRHLAYENYLLNEVLPLTNHVSPDTPLIAHGCSLGAYHAVNLAFRHPQRFVKVVALSGRYDLTAPLADFRGLFDGYYDDQVYFNTPSHYVPNLQDPGILEQLRKLHIVLVIGREDPFLDNNCRLSAELWGKGIAHEIHLWDGRAHAPYHWRKMVALYL